MAKATRTRTFYDHGYNYVLGDMADSAICNLDGCHETTKADFKKYCPDDDMYKYQVVVTVTRTKVKA